ncbi:MAG TPA: DoxX family protein [Candidatus Acidoferrales bacterium]|nr:DoxX family protein [Candidatus Acidoferrales bacterium]
MNELGQSFGGLLLRITVGGLLLFHGVSKLTHGVAWMAGPLEAFHLPFFVAYGVFVGEIVAPILIILGIWTRPAALVIAFDLFMAVILVARHGVAHLSPGGGWGIELEALYLLTALTLFFLGAGKFSVAGANGKWN